MMRTLSLVIRMPVGRYYGIKHWVLLFFFFFFVNLNFVQRLHADHNRGYIDS